MNRKLISNSNYVLRKTLNSNERKDIIKDFIESFLDIQIKELKINSYLRVKEKYLPKEDNFGIVDVRLKTIDDEEMNVGIQFIDGIYVQTKILLYFAQIHLNQLEYGDDRELVKTITINLLDFNYYKTNEYLKRIKIASNDSFVKEEELEFVVVELPKYKDDCSLDKKGQWIKYLQGGSKEIIEEIKEINPNIKLLDELVDKYWLEEKME